MHSRCFCKNMHNNCSWPVSQVVLGPAVSVKANDTGGDGGGGRVCHLPTWYEPLQTPAPRSEGATSPLTQALAPVTHIPIARTNDCCTKARSKTFTSADAGAQKSIRPDAVCHIQPCCWQAGQRRGYAGYVSSWGVTTEETGSWLKSRQVNKTLGHALWESHVISACLGFK